MHEARVVDSPSGRTLDVATTEPGIQFYAGNYLDGTFTGKNAHVYQHRTGFCLETQHFPDSRNQPAFPSTILRSGAEFRLRTVFTSGVAKKQDQRGGCGIAGMYCGSTFSKYMPNNRPRTIGDTSRSNR